MKWLIACLIWTFCAATVMGLRETYLRGQTTAELDALRLQVRSYCHGDDTQTIERLIRAVPVKEQRLATAPWLYDRARFCAPIEQPRWDVTLKTLLEAKDELTAREALLEFATPTNDDEGTH